MKNYAVKNYGPLTAIDRVTIGDDLQLTGAEVSINNLPANAESPFIHSHKKNEEIYIVLKGSGTFDIDDDTIELETGSIVHIKPAGKRFIHAGSEGISYICIQAEEGSLTQKTDNDGVVY